MSTENSESPRPVSLKKAGDALIIAWSDGQTHRLAWSLLRENCPCATCRVQRERPAEPPELLPVLGETISGLTTAARREAAPVQPTAMKPIGNYAYGIEFSDGHKTGIFAIEYLRELGERFT